jgi:hypothetical protein
MAAYVWPLSDSFPVLLTLIRTSPSTYVRKRNRDRVGGQASEQSLGQTAVLPGRPKKARPGSKLLIILFLSVPELSSVGQSPIGRVFYAS